MRSPRSDNAAGTATNNLIFRDENGNVLRDGGVHVWGFIFPRRAGAIFEVGDFGLVPRSCLGPLTHFQRAGGLIWPREFT